MNLQVYLNFQGQAYDAVHFYKNALGCEEPKVLKFGDLPPNPNFPISDEFKDYVMHTEININDSKIQISDILPNTDENLIVGNNVSIVLSFDNENDIIEKYERLSEGGKIVMPLETTMWAKKYAYFVDKFGISWQLNYFGDKVFGK